MTLRPFSSSSISGMLKLARSIGITEACSVGNDCSEYLGALKDEVAGSASVTTFPSHQHCVISVD